MSNLGLWRLSSLAWMVKSSQSAKLRLQHASATVNTSAFDVFFWGSFLSFIFFAGRCAYVESKVTDLPYFASKAPWKTTILDMLSYHLSKLMRGGDDMIWLRVVLLVFGVLSQKNKHPFTRWPSERTVLKRCILLETSTNTTLGWRLVLHKHWPRVPSRWVSFPRSHFPLLMIIDDYGRRGQQKIVKHKAIYILNSFFTFCDLHWCSFVSISKLPFFGEACW